MWNNPDFIWSRDLKKQTKRPVFLILWITNITTTHYTVYSVQCTLYSVHVYTLYTYNVVHLYLMKTCPFTAVAQWFKTSSDNGINLTWCEGCKVVVVVVVVVVVLVVVVVVVVNKEGSGSSSGVCLFGVINKIYYSIRTLYSV